MEIIISCMCSTLISIILANFVGAHYLLNQYKKWDQTLDFVSKEIIKYVEENYQRKSSH